MPCVNCAIKAMQPKLGLVVFSLALLLGAAIKELHPLLWLEVEPSQGLPVSFWHLLSAHFVHFNLYHALLNIAGVWLCYGLAYELFNRRSEERRVGEGCCYWLLW